MNDENPTLDSGDRADRPAKTHDSPDSDDLLGLARGGEATRARWLRLLSGLITGGTVFVYGITLEAFGHHATGLLGAARAGLTGLVGGVLASVLAPRLARRLTPAASVVAAQQLASRPDAHVLGALVDAAAWGDRVLEQTVLAGLRYALPTIPALDDRTLTPAQRAILYSRLRRLDPESACAVLALIPATGDRFAIRHVRRLVARSQETQVRKAAEECLAALRERCEKRKPEDVLLRPAESTNPAASVLLRPAQGTPESDSTQLLRPASKE